MPIYEFRCPNGHQFEVFQRMTDPRPDACEVCREGPLTTVLHPVPVHFKGSGFYSTDYGRGGRKRESGDGSVKDEGAKQVEKPAKPEKKAATAD